MTPTKVPAKLALETGAVFPGTLLGKPGETVAEVVFNTALSGYQEIFTDASYHGQMVVMTNPLIGNYGINSEDEESFRVHVQGIILREASRRFSNFRAGGDLGSYLEKYGITGITGVDTRAVTKLLRKEGSKKGIISSIDSDDLRLVEKARAWPGLIGQDMVSPVTCKEMHRWTRGLEGKFDLGPRGRLGAGLRIAAYDFGIKFNILRILASMGFEVIVVPARTTAEQVRALNPDGIFLSNGPGDPEGLPYAIEAVRSLIADYPTFGICLGHQLITLALGKTYKLHFGHHGGNHPVQNLFTRKVEISVQNHCFAADTKTLDPVLVKPYFVNLNDRSNEGLIHTKLPIFSVQFHPEAAPGPTDFTFLFEQFAALVRTRAPLAVSGDAAAA